MVSFIDILYLKQKKITNGHHFSAVNSIACSFVPWFINFISSLFHFNYIIIPFH